MNTQSNQPSDVSTEDAPRPGDNHVVTSDAPKSEPREAESKNTSNAEAGNNSEGPNDQGSATDSNENQNQSKRNRSAERRIKKLSQKLSESEGRYGQALERNQALEEEIERLKASVPKPKEPEFKDFDSPTEYAKAYSEWKNLESVKDAPREKAQNTHKQTSEPAPTLNDSEIDEFHELGKERLGDEFLEALDNEDVAVNERMAEFIMDSDLGPEIYVHLASNVELSKKIFKMKSRSAFAELQKIESQLKESEQKGEKDGKLKIDDPAPQEARSTNNKVSRAPKPPSSTKESGGTDIRANPESESMDDYAARRQKEIKRQYSEF